MAHFPEEARSARTLDEELWVQHQEGSVIATKQWVPTQRVGRPLESERINLLAHVGSKGG